MHSTCSFITAVVVVIFVFNLLWHELNKKQNIILVNFNFTWDPQLVLPQADKLHIKTCGMTSGIVTAEICVLLS